LLPEQDQRIQQELIRRDDLTSNLLLLQRHTGMRDWGVCRPGRRLSTSCWAGPVGYPCAARQTENRTPGSRRFVRMPDRRTFAQLAFAK
jgi:hypothetical protein